MNSDKEEHFRDQAASLQEGGQPEEHSCTGQLKTAGMRVMGTFVKKFPLTETPR